MDLKSKLHIQGNTKINESISSIEEASQPGISLDKKAVQDMIDKETPKPNLIFTIFVIGLLIIGVAFTCVGALPKLPKFAQS